MYARVSLSNGRMRSVIKGEQYSDSYKEVQLL